jgi:hypothetical protein
MPRAAEGHDDGDPALWRRHQGKIVRDIRAKGLARTRLFRLRHHLYTKIGRPFDAERLAHDLRRVRNLELFRNIRVSVAPFEDGVSILFQMSDKWSLLPFFNTFFNLGSVSVIAGVYDVNFLGTLSYVDLQLLLFSYLPLTADSIKPGGILSLGLPRLFGGPLGYDLDVRAVTSIRTLLLDHRTVGGSFLSERYGGYHYLSVEPWPWLQVYLQETLYWDRFGEAAGGSPAILPTPRKGLTHAIGMSMRLGYLSYTDYLMHGLRLWASLEGAADWLGSDFSYLRASAELRAFYRFGPRGGNLGLWVHGGYMKGGDLVHMFRVGSWTGLRGFYTDQLVARAYVAGTLEYRTGLLPMEFPVAWIIPYFRGKALRIQGAAFIDLGSVAGGGPWRPRESGELLMSVGAGLRFAAVKLYKAVLRLDFAYVVSPYRSYDFIIATQQFF